MGEVCSGTPNLSLRVGDVKLQTTNNLILGLQQNLCHGSGHPFWNRYAHKMDIHKAHAFGFRHEK